MYTPLYVKSNYSFLSSLVRIDELIDTCVKQKISSVALCDDDMISIMYFIKKCNENQIHPMIGIDLKYKECSILLYAENFKGYQNLIQLNTIQNKNETITLEEVKIHQEGVICILPYSSKSLYEMCKSCFDSEHLYLGYHNLEEEYQVSKITNQIVFLNKILYLTLKESKYYKYVTMIRDKKNVFDDISFQDDKNYLLTMKEVSTLSHEFGIKQTNLIAEKCHVEFPKNQNLLPIYQTNHEVSNDEYLKSLSIKGLEKRKGSQLDSNYKERLLYELSVISKMGFSNYFLVVYDYVKYAKKQGILVGPGRGSAGGSLVAYALGIIDIDPIEYDLLFERFLNPGRITMPDIDVDFPDIYREQVIQYVKEKYGIKNVAGIVAIGTLKAKAVLDDVGRVLKIPDEKITRLKKCIPNFNSTLKEVYKTDDSFRNMVENDERLSLLYEVSSYLEGFPRNTTTHASGIIIANEELDQIVPLLSQDGNYVCGYEMDYLEELGLLKMDFLGNRNLTIIMSIIKCINEQEPKTIDFRTIPLNDKETYQLFYNADTNGIFQFESDTMKNLLRRLKPTNFEDIIAANALVRPGPMDQEYIMRKHHQKQITYPHDNLIPVLKSTYGVIIYQEQIMQIASIMAGYTLSEADNLRRAMGHKIKEILSKEEEKFIKQSIQNGYSYEVSKKVYDLIFNFAQYGFNKSHTVAYAIIAYKMAYLKVHYSKYFYQNLLSMIIGNDAKTFQTIKEARKNKVEFILPDIRKSNTTYQITEQGILFPLSAIKGIGANVARQIEPIQQEEWIDIFDAMIKLTKVGISKKIIETFIYASCFRTFGYNQRTLIENLDTLLTYAFVAKDLSYGSDIIEKPTLEIKEEYSNEFIMQQEKELFGFYLTYHPTTKYKAKYQVIDLNQIKNYFGKWVDVIVLVEKVKLHTDKTGKNMAFLYGSDETLNLDFVLFSSVLKEQTIEKGDILLIRGKVERKEDLQIVVDNFKNLKKESF